MPASRAPYPPADIARLKPRVVGALAAGESLDDVAALPDMPSRPTIRRWARDDPAFAQALAGAREVAAERPRFPFDAHVAAAFLAHVREGRPVAWLLRRPDMPHRRRLDAWKADRPDFAAAFSEAKALADGERRRLGLVHDPGRADDRPARRRRSRMTHGEAASDRVILALIRGATLPELTRRPDMPTMKALRRWRREVEGFDGAVRLALAHGRRARGAARARAACSPRVVADVVRAILDGASLHSLGRRSDMPGRTTLYAWVGAHQDFATAVARASRLRDERLLDEAQTLAECALDPGARKAARVRLKRLGQNTPHPGQRRR